MKNWSENTCFVRCAWLFVVLVGAGCVASIALYLVKSELFCDYHSKQGLDDELSFGDNPNATESQFQN